VLKNNIKSVTGIYTKHCTDFDEEIFVTCAIDECLVHLPSPSCQQLNEEVELHHNVGAQVLCSITVGNIGDLKVK